MSVGGRRWRGSVVSKSALIGGAGRAPAPGSWRDVPLQQFAALAEIPCVRLISLQMGDGPPHEPAAAARLALWKPGPERDQDGAFTDTAAIMQNLDLVVSTDTAVAHLAGALGVPVWVALPFAPDWRWLLDRADSPWYPTMRLFRQKVARRLGRCLWPDRGGVSPVRCGRSDQQLQRSEMTSPFACSPETAPPLQVAAVERRRVTSNENGWPTFVWKKK